MSHTYDPKADFAKKNRSHQGVDLTSLDIQMYSGIDTLYNAKICDSYIYISISDEQLSRIQNGKVLPEHGYPGLSGYFTDEATVTRHFTKDGGYDAAGLAKDLQQMPYVDADQQIEAAMSGEEYIPQYNGNLLCLKIHPDKLEKEYGTRDFCAAVGKCRANDHLSPGGGNQGYNDKITELFNNGCLTYVPEKTRRSQNTACHDYYDMKSRAEVRTKDCLRTRQRTPSKEICEQTTTGPAKSVQESPFHNEQFSFSLHEALNNPTLFEPPPGEFTYQTHKYGKRAYGVLGQEKGTRNAAAQTAAGGSDRRNTDDGGHLIATRFSGSETSENLEAQDRNLNRSSYKQMENRWANSQNMGNTVYSHVETYHSHGSNRPDAFMGYSVEEHPDGSRVWDAFSYQNESQKTQQEWNDFLETTDFMENITPEKENNKEQTENHGNSMKDMLPQKENTIDTDQQKAHSESKKNTISEKESSRQTPGTNSENENNKEQTKDRGKSTKDVPPQKEDTIDTDQKKDGVESKENAASKKEETANKDPSQKTDQDQHNNTDKNHNNEYHL